MSEITIEDAIQTWVKTASALPGARVIWENQGRPRPTQDFILLRLDGGASYGTTANITETTDLSQTNQEVEIKATGWHRIVCMVEVFTHDITGNACARALAKKVQTALGLPTVRDALNVAGLGVQDQGTLQNLSALWEPSRFECRYMLTVNFTLTDAATVRTGYIDTVEAEETIEGVQVGDGEFTLTLP